MILLHQTGEWTIQSLVRAHWLITLAIAVTGVTVCAEIRHFVMAITLADACDDFANAQNRTS